MRLSYLLSLFLFLLATTAHTQIQSGAWRTQGNVNVSVDIYPRTQNTIDMHPRYGRFFGKHLLIEVGLSSSVVNTISSTNIYPPRIGASTALRYYVMPSRQGSPFVEFGGQYNRYNNDIISTLLEVNAKAGYAYFLSDLLHLEGFFMWQQSSLRDQRSADRNYTYGGFQLRLNHLVLPKQKAYPSKHIMLITGSHILM
ncbi:MAG: hypothetical protein AAF705_16705 [Bacteroidota bacterium]